MRKQKYMIAMLHKDGSKTYFRAYIAKIGKDGKTAILHDGREIKLVDGHWIYKTF